MQRNEKMTRIADNWELEEKGEWTHLPKVLLLHALGESHRARRRVRKHFRDFGVKHVCVSVNIYEAKMIIIIKVLTPRHPVEWRVRRIHENNYFVKHQTIPWWTNPHICFTGDWGEMSLLLLLPHCLAGTYKPAYNWMHFTPLLYKLTNLMHDSRDTNTEVLLNHPPPLQLLLICHPEYCKIHGVTKILYCGQNCTQENECKDFLSL